MNQGIISSRYAKALLKFAIENHEEARVYEEMCALFHAYLEVSALKAMLTNPVVSVAQKRALIAAAATTQSELSSSTARFLSLVMDKQREDLMLFIAQSYISAYRKRQQEMEGVLTLASPLSEEALQRLIASLKEKVQRQLNVTVRYDASLIGGFIFQYDSIQLDASVKSKLSNIQRELR